MIGAIVAAMALSATLAAVAAPNIYGENGLIEIPDDTLYPVGSVTPAYHAVLDVGPNDETNNFYTVGVGIFPTLSVSGGVKTNGGTDAVINGKYRLLAESAERPSVTLGVIDAAGQISNNDDPGAYILLGKNLTAAAEEVAGVQSVPLRGYLGFGTGVLSGVFFGLDWRLTPKFSAMLEYVSSDKGLDEDPHVNGGIRYAVTPDLKVDVGTVAFSKFTAGISYTAIRF
jgi:hypothetical protein